MPRIAGVTFHKNRNGRVSKVTITARRWGHLIEDMLDRIIVEKHKKSPETDWEIVKKKLDKKHGIKK